MTPSTQARGRRIEIDYGIRYDGEGSIMVVVDALSDDNWAL
jgi:hypothetical protein